MFVEPNNKCFSGRKLRTLNYPLTPEGTLKEPYFLFVVVGVVVDVVVRW